MLYMPTRRVGLSTINALFSFFAEEIKLISIQRYIYRVKIASFSVHNNMSIFGSANDLLYENIYIKKKVKKSICIYFNILCAWIYDINVWYSGYYYYFFN